jgi:hypothetical protein
MPDWVPYMVLACVAALILGWILGWAWDEWNNR